MKMTYERLCPQCSKNIIYKNRRVCERSELAKKLCGTCARKSVWAREDSPLRSAETRTKRNNGVKQSRKSPDHRWNDPDFRRQFGEKCKQRHADPNSAYNTLEYREKLSTNVRAALSGSTRMFDSEVVARRTQSLKEMWTPELRKQHSEMKKKWWTIERREQYKKTLSRRWETEVPFYQFSASRQVSKFELKFKDALNEHGFIHSTDRVSGSLRVGRYIPDYVNEQSKQIIEFNGDYWHCNPTHPTFGNPDWYHPDLKMISSERWEKDREREAFLQSLGYDVFNIWESEASTVDQVLAKLPLSGSRC